MTINQDTADPDDDGKGVEMEIELLYVGTDFKTLFDEDIWICNTRVLTHLTNNMNRANNVWDSGTPSLGHTGTAVKEVNMIDLKGQFVGNDGK